LVRESIGHGIDNTWVEWVAAPTSPPGIVTAAPSMGGSASKRVAYTFGTSNSAALISHEAIRCYDALVDVFRNEGKDIPEEHIALLLKAMIVHGAEWGDLADMYNGVSEMESKRDRSRKLPRYVGYGKPNIDKAIECAKNRVTLIGYGDLPVDGAHVYDLPLPFVFNVRTHRRLTSTLAYFPPISSTRLKYRAAKLWFDIINDNKNLLGSRVGAEAYTVQRGSVQHEIFENNQAVAWDESGSIQVKINCRKDIKEIKMDSVPYALMVSFEMRDAIDIDVYTKVRQIVTTKVMV
jgi:hypothetical protein